MYKRGVVFSLALFVGQFGIFLPAQADTLGLLSLADEQPDVTEPGTKGNE